MSNGYGVKKAPHANTFGSGAYDRWNRSSVTPNKASEIGALSYRLKHMKISLAPVPIKDSERSDTPIAKLLDTPDQEWHLDDIEQSLKTKA